jgi:riboflavin kinase/FMN adenylyltransferase
LTFDPPPQAILAPDRPLGPPLTTIARRAELLGSLGVDALIAYPTDRALLSLSAVDFFEQFIVGKLRAGAMVEGPNFRFGRDRGGDTALLQELCRSAGMDCSIAQASEDQAGMISSSRVRRLLAEGDIAAANAMLTENYQLNGLVSAGARRGRELGFPTANLTQIASQVPAHGVYAGSAALNDQWLPAAINIGPNPTFDDSDAKVEVHIIGWQGTLYGERLTCSLKERIRDVMKFESLASLQQQIRQDIATAASLQTGP